MYWTFKRLEMTVVRKESGLIKHLKFSKNFVNIFSMLGEGWVLERFGGDALPVVAIVFAYEYEYLSSVSDAGFVGHEVNLLLGDNC